MPEKVNLPLSTLLLLVGDEHLSFQTLDTDFISAHHGNGGASITFSTESRKVTEMAARAVGAAEPAELGLVVWLPRTKARMVTKGFVERPSVEKIAGADVGVRGSVVVLTLSPVAHYVVLSPEQARQMALQLLDKAAAAEK